MVKRSDNRYHDNDNRRHLHRDRYRRKRLYRKHDHNLSDDNCTERRNGDEQFFYLLERRSKQRCQNHFGRLYYRSALPIQCRQHVCRRFCRSCKYYNDTSKWHYNHNIAKPKRCNAGLYGSFIPCNQ